MDSNGNLHKGHRDRMKSKFISSGLDTFDDHQVLELLLYYAIPQKDTNPIGHRLIKEFGSLAAVFEAGLEELQNIPDVGRHLAVLLKLIPELARRYSMDRIGKHPILNTSEKAGEFVCSLFVGHNTEVLYMLCLDGRCTLKKIVKLHEGTLDEVAVYPRTIIENALRTRTKNIILAHNHPSGSLRPSPADIKVTRNVLEALYNIEINLIDHFIVTDSGYFSFVQNDVINSDGLPENIRYAAEVED